MRLETQRLRRQEAMVNGWNSRHPIGSAVKVRMDSGLVMDTSTRSEAYLLGGHTAVVLCIGISGAYSLERVTAREAPEYAG